MTDGIDDLTLLELIERFKPGAEDLGEPIVIHHHKHAQIGYCHPDLLFQFSFVCSP
jgi:hypothetical protein